ncbi:preprotein translocase subunit SecY [Hydrogenivirga sp. 128-5-R1-1]|uniref:preprotein translocase subunit SecY n=1 Tax=Hydrogenivirga sp. 128-5-R1-1 TaxID=392423 RepID=UPI00015EF87E|nr:preprotein translocase subunit SecY [Hydrogenivirga sp. 128-5-R1-1]EDP74973.1 preprotein translocase SecY [Hydrogenivirga sp. 128-5-R1-1]
MIDYLKNIFVFEDLRRRFLYTLFMFAIYRLGSHIPIPGVDVVALEDFFKAMQGTLFNLYDIFSGGNLSRMTVFALGVMPYISASIMMQLLTVAIPELQRLAKEEGDYGRYKINEYTKYLTLFVAFVQSIGIAFWLQNQTSPRGFPVVPEAGFLFIFVSVMTLVAGTMFLVWMGERITEKGIGNGMSLLIFAGIVAGFPNAVISLVDRLRSGDLAPFAVAGAVVMVLLVIVGIVYIQEAERRIPVQYPRRVVGRQEYRGGSTYLPIKINPAGVIPIIFAQSLLIIPSSVLTFIQHPIAQVIYDAFNPTSIFYNFLYVMLIVFFTYFYTAVMINPVEVADNLRKGGAFIPGVRPGLETQKFLETVINRLVFVGALFLSVVAIIPLFISLQLNVPFYFGGTTALIVVGVALDTLKQVEANLITKKYKGYVRKRR